MNYIKVLNYTSFFNREIMLYSLDDIKLAFPIPLKKAVWFLGFIGIYTVPLFIFFGVPQTIYGLITYFGPPVFLSIILNKKVWANRSVLDLLIISVKYIKQPKVFAGIYAYKQKQIKIGYTTTVSRLEDHYKLYSSKQK